MNTASEVILYSDDKYEIRPARNLSEIKELWWGFMQTLGANRGYDDLETYMNPSIGYKMILLIDKSSNEPVGHVSAVINSNSTGWISMLVVDEAHQGNGMGGQLFKAAIADFDRNGTSIRGLDSVPQQKDTYGRRQFTASPLGNIKIMARPLIAREPTLVPALKGQFIDLRNVPQDLLVKHELKYTGFDRRRLWNDENLFQRPDVLGVALVDKAQPRSVEDIQGWTVIRRCSGGVRLGPLYASDVQCAEAVLGCIVEKATAQYISSLPLPNEAMNDWTEERIAREATIVVEVWSGNPEALALFAKNAWKSVTTGLDTEYRMWVDGKATTQFSAGGLAQQGVFAVFDTAIG